MRVETGSHTFHKAGTAGTKRVVMQHASPQHDCQLPCPHPCAYPVCLQSRQSGPGSSTGATGGMCATSSQQQRKPRTARLTRSSCSPPTLARMSWGLQCRQQCCCREGVAGALQALVEVNCRPCKGKKGGVTGQCSNSQHGTSSIQCCSPACRCSLVQLWPSSAASVPEALLRKQRRFPGVSAGEGQC